MKIFVDLVEDSVLMVSTGSFSDSSSEDITSSFSVGKLIKIFILFEKSELSPSWIPPSPSRLTWTEYRLSS